MGRSESKALDNRRCELMIVDKIPMLFRIVFYGYGVLGSFRPVPEKCLLQPGEAVAEPQASSQRSSPRSAYTRFSIKR